jgi:hypothetical protein
LPKNRPNTSPNEPGDFDRFKSFMGRLMAVPHSELKAKLDAEKKHKQRGKKAKKSNGK